MFANIILVCRDIAGDGVLLRLHAGFLVLYASQAAFILVHERYVCVLTVLQGVLALLSSADFTFAPLVRVFGRMYFLFGTPSVEGMKAYKYVFFSLCFTLQMLSAFALFSLLPKYTPKKKETKEIPA
ncbi:MAG: hypothetical protein ACI351_05780 [Candidatus Avelusimicrobium sp.]|uniref:hypothetical protein n=1 Tax=Candidatus Avelusimicrobium sp. TaxID=3048833 RepID=UPI003EFE1E00